MFNHKRDFELVNDDKKYQIIFEESLSAIVIADDNGQYLEANNAASEMFGYSIDELLTMKVSDIETTTKSGSHEQYQEYIKKEQASGEFHFLNKAGEQRIAMYRALRVKPDFNMSILFNITEQKKVEQEIYTLNQRYRKAQRIAKVGNWEFNLQTQEFWGSDEGKRIYGFDPEIDEFTAEEVYKHVIDRESVEQAMVDLLESNKKYDIEFEITPKDGSGNKFIRSIAKIEYDVNGNPHKVTGVLHDITDKKKAEKEILIYQDYLQKSQEIGKIGTWHFDIKKNNIVWTNETYKIFGIEKGTPINAELFNSFIHPEDKERVAEQQKKSFENSDDSDIEHRIIVKGKTKWIRQKYELIHDENGNLIGSIGVVQDIDKEKGIETKLAEQAHKLEQLNLDKDEFISVLAHDLKNPFNSLIGFSGMLLKHFGNWDEEKIKNNIEIIHNLAKNTHKLLENTLLWIQSDKETQPAFHFYAHEAINSELISLLPLSNEKHIKLENNVQQDINLFMDINILKVVFRNLISNAIKYTNEGGVIKIGSEIKNQTVKFMVMDNGVGIAKEDIRPLFDINHHNSTPGTKNEAGSGFGLRICQKLLKNINGTLSVDSTPGEGSNFYFTVPFNSKQNPSENSISALKQQFNRSEN